MHLYRVLAASTFRSHGQFLVFSFSAHWGRHSSAVWHIEHTRILCSVKGAGRSYYNLRIAIIFLAPKYLQKGARECPLSLSSCYVSDALPLYIYKYIYICKYAQLLASCFCGRHKFLLIRNGKFCKKCKFSSVICLEFILLIFNLQMLGIDAVNTKGAVQVCAEYFNNK